MLNPFKLSFKGSLSNYESWILQHRLAGVGFFLHKNNDSFIFLYKKTVLGLTLQVVHIMLVAGGDQLIIGEH